MDKLLHNVGDLPSPERSAVETLIGHTLRDDQQLYIVALDAAVEPTENIRRQAWNEIEVIIAESHQNVRQSGVSQEELERTIDETCDEVRYGK
jgi:hypothetical protein